MTRYLEWIIFLVVCFAGGGVLYFKRPDLFNRGKVLLVKEIQSTPDDREGAPQDIITFSDQTTLKGIGYDVVHVGTINLDSKPPVFLFKGFSCRACEPEIKLVVYNSGNKTTDLLPFPGTKYLLDEESEEGGFSHEGTASESVDQVVEAVFGQCADKSDIMMALKKHHDGPDEWQYTLTIVSFDSDGKTQIKNSAEDGFAILKSKVSADCLIIEPEDSNQYL